MASGHAGGQSNASVLYLLLRAICKPGLVFALASFAPANNRQELFQR